MFRTIAITLTVATLGAALGADLTTAQTCANAGAAATTASAAHLRSGVRCLVNAERAARGLTALRNDLDLRQAATRHAADMVRRGYFAHVSPEGRSVAQRAKRAGYLRGARSWAVGEDIGWATGAAASAQGIVQAWMASPSHRAVILDRRYREVGLGIARGLPQGGHGTTYVLNAGVVR